MKRIDIDIISQRGTKCVRSCLAVGIIIIIISLSIVVSRTCCNLLLSLSAFHNADDATMRR